MLASEYIDCEISVIRSKRKSVSIEIKEGKLIVRAPLRMKDKEIDKFLELKKNWIEKHLIASAGRQKEIENLGKYTTEELKSFVSEAKRIIPERVKYYADKIGVDYNNITIRKQHKRWGSCSSQGNLNFNCLLVLMPEEVLDSVVVHELCHRKHMNHSQKFYAEVEKAFPEYKKWHKWLKENGELYLARLP
ncbi:MAG: M48 family metallopeptidase [Clostridia bacterium]|nr:M48 family metallopeptidase [Clostridia bacterium]